MYPLQAAVTRGIMLTMDDIAIIIPPRPKTHVGFSKSIHTLVSYVGAFDQADPLQLRESGQSCDRVVRQVCAAAQIDVTYPIATVNQALHSLVRKMPTVTEMDVVQVLAQARDGEDGCIRDIPALGKHEIAEARSHVDNLFHGAVGETSAGCQIEDAEMFVGLVRRKG